MTIKKVGRYQVIRELGRGGMALVYLARDPQFERQVAIKVLPHQLTFDPQFRARFEREAKVIASLEHSAIVPVYDYGEEDGQPYLVMRYMGSGSLRERLAKKALDLASARKIIGRLASALNKAHKLGVIHRDIKPENILFDDEENAYISDFGIAQLAETSQALSGSMVVGTPAYMSPEQARGQAKLDGRSDQYALGIILFEMLTGKQPFRADTPLGSLMAQINDPPPAILEIRPDLPKGIAGVLSKVLAKTPAQRFASTEAFSVALEETTAKPDSSSPSVKTKNPKASRPAAPPTRVIQGRKQAGAGAPPKRIQLKGRTLITIAAAGWGLYSLWRQ